MAYVQRGLVTLLAHRWATLLHSTTKPTREKKQKPRKQSGCTSPTSFICIIASFTQLEPKQGLYKSKRERIEEDQRTKYKYKKKEVAQLALPPFYFKGKWVETTTNN